MLSPGQWYKSLPSNPVANVRVRLEILRLCEADLDFRRGIMLICAQDFVFFVAVFGWQFNPKKKGKEAIGPFIPWDFQVEAMLAEPTDEDDEDNRGLLWCYEHNQDVVVEKSRDMGISWWFLFMQDWLCWFTKYVKSLNISKNAEAVDDKDPDSLFWKIRFIHQWLPDWFKEGVKEQSMFFAYPTESFITGTASTSSAGVSGRASTIFIDEFPRIKEDVAVRSGTASTSDSRFFNGTHQGTATEFYKLTQTPEIVKFVFHWSQHPEKNKGLYRWNQVLNRPDIIDTDFEFPHDYQFDTTGKPEGGPYPGLRSPWYDKKVISIGSDVEAAQELDINPSGSVSQYFQPLIIRKLALEYCVPPVWVGECVKEGKTYKLVESVPGEDPGPLKLWVRPDRNGKLPEATYKLGCDLSQGFGKTNSCVAIFNADVGERVGEYVTPHVYPENLAPIVVWLCKLLVDESGDTAELIWEKNGPGTRFGLEIVASGYRRFFWEQGDEENGIFQNPKAKAPGWNPSPKNKLILMDHYRSALRNFDFINRSELAMQETLLFQLSPDAKNVYHAGSLNKKDPSGAGINHGDRVWPDALCWKLSKDHAKKLQEQEEDEGPPELSVLWRRQWNKDRAKRQARRRR